MHFFFTTLNGYLLRLVIFNILTATSLDYIRVLQRFDCPYARNDG